MLSIKLGVQDLLIKTEADIQKTFDRIAALFMALVCAINLLVIARPLFNQSLLASLHPGVISMTPGTVLIFLGLCGAWIIYRATSGRHGMRILVQVAVLGMSSLGIISTFKFASSLSTDLEQLFYTDPLLFGQINSESLSPLVVLCFSVTISAFLFLTRRNPGWRTKSVAAALSLVGCVLSGLLVLSYIYGAPSFYGDTLIPVPVTTALSFLFLSLGLLMTAGPSCWPVRIFLGPSLQARLMRAFIPALLMIVLFQGFFNIVLESWIENPALRVVISALAPLFIVIYTIIITAKKISGEIGRKDQGRLEAEKALNQSEIRFRTIVEFATDAIVNSDRNGLIVFWNQAAETIFGYSAGEVVGKPLGLIMPEEFRTAHQQGLQHVVMTGETHIIGKTVEVAGLRKDGRVIPLALSLATWQVAGDVFFTAIARDISDQKQSEEELQFKNTMLHTQQEASLDGILVVDEDFHIVLYNHRFAEMWGIPLEMIEQKIDEPVLQHVAEQVVDRPSFLKLVQYLYENKQEKSKDELVLKDERVIERYSELMIGSDDCYYGRVWYFRDITERKRAEQAIHESEEKFRTLFNNAQVGMFRTRFDGSGFLDMNERLLAIFGRTRVEMQGLATPIYWADPQQREEMVRHLETEGFVTDFECGMLNKQGEVRICLTSIRHYREQGIFEGSLLDITERKQNQLIQDAIFRITQMAIISDGIDILYQSIHTILGELIPAENFFIALYDPVNELISFPYYIDQYDEKPSSPTQVNGLTGYVIRSGRPLLATREIFNQLVETGEVESIGTQGEDWLGVPLKIEGRIMGVIGVQSYTPGIHFHQNDVDLLEFVSAQVAQVIERNRLVEEIHDLSLTDELTGLYNLRGFTLLAEQELKLARREKRTLLLFFGDVDNLKTINDTLGHTQGDLALRELSTILKKSFRESDILARIGGDEFLALSVSASKENAEIVVNRIQATLEDRNQRGGTTYDLALSLGSARYDPEDSQYPEGINLSGRWLDVPTEESQERESVG